MLLISFFEIIFSNGYEFLSAERDLPETFTFYFSPDSEKNSSQSSENSLKLNRQYSIDCGVARTSQERNREEKLFVWRMLSFN